MKKLLFTLIIVIFTSMATASIYYDTGLNYTIGATNPNDSTIYLGSNINDFITLDYYTVNSPGTHLELVDGGDAGVAVGLVYFVEAVEEQGELVGFQPGASEGAGRLVGDEQFFYQPVGQGLPLPRPG